MVDTDTDSVASSDTACFSFLGDSTDEEAKEVSQALVSKAVPVPPASASAKSTANDSKRRSSVCYFDYALIKFGFLGY